MKASIVIPAFNAQKTIENCLQALENQSIPRSQYEIIVVDDGSQDETPAIVQKFATVKLFRQKNAGPAKARNLGAKKAINPLLIFTDSDCVATPTFLEEMIKPFHDKNVAGAQGAYETKQKSLMARFNQIEIEERYELMKESKSLDWIGSYAAGYRKEIFLKLGGFDERFPSASGEDPELSYKMQERHFTLAFNPAARIYHTHPESLAHYLKVKFYRAFYRIPLYQKHRQKMVKDSYTPQIMKVQIATIYLIAVLTAYALLPFKFISFPIILNPLFWLYFYAVTLLPFTVFALTRDFMVGLIAPFIITLRNIMFCLGLPAGIIWSKKR